VTEAHRTIGISHKSTNPDVNNICTNFTCALMLLWELKKCEMSGEEQQLWKALKWMLAFDAFFIAEWWTWAAYKGSAYCHNWYRVICIKAKLGVVQMWYICYSTQAFREKESRVKFCVVYKLTVLSNFINVFSQENYAYEKIRIQLAFEMLLAVLASRLVSFRPSNDMEAQI
jgi:hypothetical protein